MKQIEMLLDETLGNILDSINLDIENINKVIYLPTTKSNLKKYIIYSDNSVIPILIDEITGIFIKDEEHLDYILKIADYTLFEEMDDVYYKLDLQYLIRLVLHHSTKLKSKFLLNVYNQIIDYLASGTKPNIDIDKVNDDIEYELVFLLCLNLNL